MDAGVSRRRLLSFSQIVLTKRIGLCMISNYNAPVETVLERTSNAGHDGVGP